MTAVRTATSSESKGLDRLVKDKLIPIILWRKEKELLLKYKKKYVSWFITYVT